MSAASLFAWIATVFVGLLLLVIWLIEYDPQFQGAAATRLPIPVISTHALLGMAGLLLWGAYLLADEDRLAYATIADLGIAVVLGLTMAGRWIRVYRTYRRPSRREAAAAGVVTVPPERNFPVSAVLLHGILAITTVVLVVLTVLTD
jgi:manganese efflux pump family protein